MTWSMYISREKEHWIVAVSAGRESIPLSDWIAVVRSDPQFDSIDDVEKIDVVSPSTGKTDSPRAVSARWHAHPGPGPKSIWFWWENGMIQVSRPDWPTRRKIADLARKLEGTVQDDAGLIYSQEDLLLGKPDTMTPVVQEPPSAMIESELERNMLRGPAVPVSESVQDDRIICLEDGKSLSMLRNYIWRQFRLTPEGYRARWGLPSNYPMVAPKLLQRRAAVNMVLEPDPERDL